MNPGVPGFIRGPCGFSALGRLDQKFAEADAHRECEVAVVKEREVSGPLVPELAEDEGLGVNVELQTALARENGDHIAVLSISHAAIDAHEGHEPADGNVVVNGAPRVEPVQSPPRGSVLKAPVSRKDNSQLRVK